jgi:hypothetical protein
VKLCTFDGCVATVAAAVTAATCADTGCIATVWATVFIDRHQSFVGVTFGLHWPGNLIFHQVGFLALMVVVFIVAL